MPLIKGDFMKKQLITLLIIASTVTAEENNPPDITVVDVRTQELHPPVYQNDDGDDTLQINGLPLLKNKNRTWLRISTRYETRPEWIDRLCIEFYLLLPGKEKTTTLFKGVVHYVDIPKGRDHLAEMYIHFNTYERYYRRGSIQSAILIKIDETIVATDQKNLLDNMWWEKHPAPFHKLLNRMDTPFRVINTETHEAQKVSSYK